MSTSAVLCGLGAYVPPRIVTNDDLGATLDVTDDWIYTRTGIRRRHMVEPGVATSDLAVEAGRRAVESAGGTVDAVVVATATPDHQMPATAPVVAARLGLTGVAAFDVNAVCTGFVYALATANGLLSTGLAERVLVIGADAFSTVTDPGDRVVRPLFGDGAGAVVLRSGSIGEPGSLLSFDLGSDGNGADLIVVPAGGSRKRDGAQRYVTMDGREVFLNAVARMTQSSRAVIERAGVKPHEVDLVVAHQANIRILRSVASQLDLPEERLVSNLERVGNTSAASIPLALADAVADGTLRRGNLVLLTAFGSGLTWGSTLLEWPEF